MNLSDKALKRFSNASISTEHDLLNELTTLVESMGSQRAVADRLGVSPQWLQDVLVGRRPVSGELAGRLGWERKTVFVRRET